jgi:hypothetical protein
VLRPHDFDNCRSLDQTFGQSFPQLQSVPTLPHVQYIEFHVPSTPFPQLLPSTSILGQAWHDPQILPYPIRHRMQVRSQQTMVKFLKPSNFSLTPRWLSLPMHLGSHLNCILFNAADLLLYCFSHALCIFSVPQKKLQLT